MGSLFINNLNSSEKKKKKRQNLLGFNYVFVDIFRVKMKLFFGYSWNSNIFKWSFAILE